MYYLIRVKDGGGGSMTGSFDLPDENEFDHDMQLILTRKQTKDVKAKPKKFKLLQNPVHLTIWIYMTKKILYVEF